MAIQRVTPGEIQELLNQWITNQEEFNPARMVEITETESEFIIKKDTKRRQLGELKGLGKELWQTLQE